MRGRASILVLFLGVVACLKLPRSAKSKGAEEATDTASSQLTETNTSVTASPPGPRTATIKASVATAQQLAAAPDSSLRGTSVTFPPGSLAVDTVISMQEGETLATDDIARDLGVNDSQAFAAAGPAVSITSSELIDASQAFTVNLTIANDSALRLDNLTLVVIYKVRKASAGGAYSVGYIAHDKLQVNSGSVAFETVYFGSYQAVYTRVSIPTPNANPQSQTATASVAAATSSAAVSSAETSTGTATASGEDGPTVPNPGSFTLTGPSGTWPSRSIDLTWTPSSDADSMVVSLSTDPDCSDSQYETEVAASLGVAKLTAVANGSYYACAEAINTAGSTKIQGAAFSVGSVVVGQPDFSSTNCSASASCTAEVSGAVFAAGRLIVTEETNNRVLIWNTLPTSNGTAADLVLGQADFTAVDANRGGSPSANTLSAPSGAAFDGTKLVVADTLNNRILVWTTWPTENGQSADLVLGQTNFTVTSGAISATQMNMPYFPFIDNDRLLVADFNNCRIMVWDTFPTSNGQAANLVVGQANKTTNSAGTTASTLDAPISALAINGDLWVADSNGNRVLRYHPFPTTDGAAADLVLGQANMTSNNFLAAAADSFYYPYAMTTDGTRLLVPDFLHNRILVWNTLPTSTNAPASYALGQPDLVTDTAHSAGADTFSGPAQVQYADGMIVVSDYSFKRVLLRPFP